MALPVMLTWTPMGISDNRIQAAANRILRTWSLIKMVPDHRLSPLRPPLVDALYEESHLTEDELVVLGLKYLHRADKARGGGRAARRRGIE
jgi:hypothetical protein